mmetsp:Transcript_48758/g.103674  ORF Transcript_48758/g.103674 Transcript_48758/m.103674 type:complete len:538 (-) Transcript_48758:209-1822(-)
MTLFAALTAKDGDAEAGPSSSSPPEAIQLHSDRVIDFLNGTTVHLLKNRGPSKSSGGEEPGAEGSGANANSDASNEGQSKYFSALSYQAIQTQQDDGPLLNKPGGAAAARRHLRPDLGVWDCRVNGNKVEAPALLLKRAVMDQKKQQQTKEASGEEKKGEEVVEVEEKNEGSGIASPIVMAVDLSDPSEVQPVVERMRNVILSVYDSDVKTDAQVQCTTSIKALQASAFGKILIQEEVAVKGGSSFNEQRLALILAVIVPSTINTAASSSSAAEEYKEKQARALLLYHLHKFSLEVNCTLCFVSENESSSDVSAGDLEGEEKQAETSSAENDPLLGRNSTMSVDELGKVIRRVAMGLSPVELGDVVERTNGEKEENKDGSKGEDGAPSRRPPSIHAPGSHDAELIQGAYLRNASCEGLWDASKDDLDAALPPRSKNNTEEKDKAAKEEKTGGGGGGDEEWLSQLASSVGLSPESVVTTSAGEALTPTASDRAGARRDLKKRESVKKRPARKNATRNKDSKPKDEKEVMNFFDNLLKK